MASQGLMLLASPLSSSLPFFPHFNTYSSAVWAQTASLWEGCNAGILALSTNRSKLTIQVQTSKSMGGGSFPRGTDFSYAWRVWPWCCKSASAAMLVFCPRSTCKVNVSHKRLIFAIIKLKNLMSLIFEQTWPRMSHRHKTLLAGKSSLPIHWPFILLLHTSLFIYIFFQYFLFSFSFSKAKNHRGAIWNHMNEEERLLHRQVPSAAVKAYVTCSLWEKWSWWGSWLSMEGWTEGRMQRRMCEVSGDYQRGQ